MIMFFLLLYDGPLVTVSHHNNEISNSKVRIQVTYNGCWDYTTHSKEKEIIFLIWNKNSYILLGINRIDFLL